MAAEIKNAATSAADEKYLRMTTQPVKKLIAKFNDATYGAVLRYCFYEINLLGDPETKLHDLKEKLLNP